MGVLAFQRCCEFPTGGSLVRCVQENRKLQNPNKVILWDEEMAMVMQNGRWYAKVALASAALGAGMELFMIRTGFYEKVVDLEAQRRADEIQAAREEHATSQRPQEQPTLPNMGTREGAIGPS